MRFSDLWHC